MTKAQQYKLTIVKSIRFSQIQIEAFDTLNKYNVDVDHFIREAIKEKIVKDWPMIKKNNIKNDCPF